MIFFFSFGETNGLITKVVTSGVLEGPTSKAKKQKERKNAKDSQPSHHPPPPRKICDFEILPVADQQCTSGEYLN